VVSFDEGGVLPEGLSLVENKTGKPEPVGHNMRPVEEHYHFDFRNSTFSGNKREFEDMVVKAIEEAKRKGRIKKDR
jgi:hypothetical protein